MFLPARRFLLALQSCDAGPSPRTLPDRSAFVAWWGHRDAAAPLLFDRDIVVLDLWADDGKDAPVLIRELLAQGRRVMLLEFGIPPSVLAHVTAGFQVRHFTHRGLRLIEIR